MSWCSDTPIWSDGTSSHVWSSGLQTSSADRISGPHIDGIFEKFYRQYDLLLRNSLQELKVKLLLTQSQKQNLSSYAKIVIRGVSFFFNKLKFTLGGKSEPTESELRTIALTTPINGPHIRLKEEEDR